MKLFPNSSYKNIFLKISLFILFLLMITHSSLTYKQASKSLIVWFNTLVPTLLPVLIISNLIIITQTWKLFIPIFHPILNALFCTSPSGSLAIILGVLCGYPVGAKIVSDLYSKKELSYSEARRLLTFVTFPSPMFLNGYIFNSYSHHRILILIAIYGSAICIGIFLSIKIRKIRFSSKSSSLPIPQAQPNAPLTFKMLQQILLSSSEVLLFAGIYMMIATILAGFLELYLINITIPFLSLLTGILEMTTGITFVLDCSLSPNIISTLIVFLCCFGGVSIALQTSVVLPKEVEFSKQNTFHLSWFSYYFIWKIIHALLAVCIFQILSFL